MEPGSLRELPTQRPSPWCSLCCVDCPGLHLWVMGGGWGIYSMCFPTYCPAYPWLSPRCLPLESSREGRGCWCTWRDVWLCPWRRSAGAEEAPLTGHTVVGRVPWEAASDGWSTPGLGIIAKIELVSSTAEIPMGHLSIVGKELRFEQVQYPGFF